MPKLFIEESRKSHSVRPRGGFVCETCGNTTGSMDDEGFCLICHADDFLPMQAWELGSDFFRKMITQAKCHPPISKGGDWSSQYWHFNEAGAIPVGHFAPYWKVTANGQVFNIKGKYLAFSVGEVNDLDRKPKITLNTLT